MLRLRCGNRARSIFVWEDLAMAIWPRWGCRALLTGKVEGLLFDLARKCALKTKTKGDVSFHMTLHDEWLITMNGLFGRYN